MTSNDFIIRTERNVIDIVLSSEGKIDILRRDFEDFKLETRQNFSAVIHQQEILASEVRGLDKTVDRLISMFSLWLVFLTIAVAIAPMLREFFVYRHDKSLNEKISVLEAQIKDLQQKLS